MQLVTILRCFTRVAAGSAPYYFLFNCYFSDIGSFQNTLSIIRDAKHGSFLTSVSTPGIMSALEYRRFWVSYDRGNIQVGRGEETDPFMEWRDVMRRITVKYVGIASWRDNAQPISWIFYTYCDE